MLKDILTRAHYENNKSSMRGWCGYPLFSDRYLEWVEETAFGMSLKSRVGSYFDYTQNVLSQLSEVRDELQRDIDQGVYDNDYITDPCKDNLLKAVENLEKCGVSCYDLSKPFGAAGTVVAPGVGTIAGAIIGGVLYALVGDALVGKFLDGLFYLVE